MTVPPDPTQNNPESRLAAARRESRPVSPRQVRRLAKLVTNFDKAVEALPDGDKYLREQERVADARRQAQMNEGLLRLRVR
jgi:hypothetical protein